MSLQDKIIKEFDIALKTLSNKKSGTEREYPTTDKSPELSDDEKKLSSQLMRVNLAGEVAAQALYRGQAFVCKDQNVRDHLVHAGDEETDHLIWCKKRLDELGGRQSILNPIWYAGSFAIGAFFGSLGEGKSLGFVEETEKQVVKHLEKHLDRVSENDVDTIEILTKGGPSKTTYVMMYAIFEKAIMQNITSIGAAITVVFIVFIILLTFFQRYVIEKRVHY